MARRWSKLQKSLMQMVSPTVKLQIHCAVYDMKSQYGSTGLPRYWITLSKEIIWDYPRQFVSLLSLAPGAINPWPYATDISEISGLIREYIDTPREQLLEKTFPDDRWNLTELLRAADRRIGVERLRALAETTSNPAVQKILTLRLGKGTGNNALTASLDVTHPREASDRSPVSQLFPSGVDTDPEQALPR